MENTSSAMDKKALTARCQLPSIKNGSEPPLKDYGKKSGPQYARKREYDRPELGRKPMAGRGGRSGQRYVRPREKMGGQVEPSLETSEVGSLYRAGGKKQNITHLMNWWGPGYRSQHSHGGERNYQGSGARIRRYSSNTPKYSKEHYLQANCQFVVQEGEDYSVYLASADLLVEWKLVEEVRVHMSQAPSCPICLHQPTAAKVTRCGHIYCYPCMLHYLALSDENWRKCPICYEPVDREDLKSVVAICHKDFGIGEEIELQLMRRERDSLLPMPAASFSPKMIEDIPRIGVVTAANPYSKLLLASKEEVKIHILDRELRDLTAQLVEEGDQPESCFITEALALLQSRRDAISACSDTLDTVDLPEGELEALSLSSPEEPSSCESLPSSEDPLSPFSPDDCKIQSLDEFGCATGEEVLSCASETPSEVPTVTVDDLDISHLQPCSLSSKGGQGPKNAPKSTFFFYQASNGAQIYLHSLNVKMLVQEYGSLENCPPIIKAKVLEKETTTMTEELRNRLRYLRHLPVACCFDVVEVSLGQPLLSKLTESMFQDQVEMRQRKRNKRAREERRIEKRVQAEEDRMLGRSKGATNMKIDSLTQFPAFSDDFPSSSVTMVPETANLSMSVGSDSSTSPTSDSLYGSSADTNGTGVSFARMIREGQTKLPHSQSEPKTFGNCGTVWPSLGVTGGTGIGRQNGPVTTVRSNSSSSWRMKHSASFSAATGPSCGEADGSDDENEALAVPEFKNAFSDAIAQALDAAAKNAAAKNGEIGACGSVGKKGKKKKQKQVLLFSSGGFN